ncbi:hypothetical protein niasHS_004428 [Heterodera schachtii]|uniref:Uncharacterized protein n=1 Tax=Heterodera schachtii TaxID=97005 RepID=A0ABD2JRD8_HETSC
MEEEHEGQSSPAAETVVEFLAKFDTLTASTADVGSIMNTISMNLFSFLKLTFRIGTLVAGALNISTKYIQTHTVEHCTIGLSSEQISLQAQFVPMLKKIRMQIRSEMEKKI